MALLTATEWIPAEEAPVSSANPFETKNTSAGRLGEDLPPVKIYDIFSDVEQIASAFTCGFPLLGDGKPMASEDIVHFRVDGETVFVGRCDYTTSRIVAAKRRLSCVGRDFGYFLVDNDMPMVVSFDPVTITNIARRAAVGSPLNKVVGRDVSDIKVQIKTEPGETRVAFLRRYLQLTDHIAFVNEKAQLVVGKPSTEPAVGRFLVKDGATDAVLDARVRMGPAMAISECRVLMNSAFGFGADDTAIWTERSDPQPSLYGRRRVSLLAPEVAKVEDARALARNTVARSDRERLTVEITIRDHKYEGVVPKADSNWEIEIDGDDPVNEELYLKAIRYSRDANDIVATTMVFVRRDTVVSKLRLAPTSVFG